MGTIARRARVCQAGDAGRPARPHSTQQWNFTERGGWEARRAESSRRAGELTAFFAPGYFQPLGNYYDLSL